MVRSGLIERVARERPILFSGEMVRAILGGRKTETRRVVKDQSRLREPTQDHGALRVSVEYQSIYGSWQPWVTNAKSMRCPYGQLGDQLWVRETWSKPYAGPAGYVFRADYLRPTNLDPSIASERRWSPSIHMRKEAARLWLRVTDVRIERLQDVSEEGAKAEGVEIKRYGDPPWFCTRDYSRPAHADGWFPGFCADTGKQFRSSFQTLWDSINTKRSYGWDSNPWVWVIAFERIEREAA